MRFSYLITIKMISAAANLKVMLCHSGDLLQHLYVPCYYVTLPHLRVKEPPGLHFVCNPASQVTYEM